MLTTSTMSGIQEEELNFMRYFLALKSGRNAMARVFEWSYQGTHPIKDYLLSQPSYSNRKFKNDFNQDQRGKLASSLPAQVRSFDISLLFSLLQLTCGLSQGADPVWRSPGPTLENLLYRLKQLRNNAIHELHMLTEIDLDNKLSELQQLIEDIYQTAALRFGKSSLLVTHLCTEVCQQFLNIKLKIRETLKAGDVSEMKQLQEEIQQFGDKMKMNVKVLGVKELYDQYQSLYMIHSLPGFCRKKFKPSLTFTQLHIEEDQVLCVRPSQMKQVRHVKCQDILQVTLQDGSQPDIILLSGDAGVGKTTFFKYLLEQWLHNTGIVHGLDQVDLLLYIQCRDSGISSFNQLLEQLLHKTIQTSNVDIEVFRDTILRLKTIILIDGYDEVNEDSESLVQDIVQVSGRVRVFLSTRPGCADHLTSSLPSTCRSLDLLVKGIFTLELRSQYCSKMIDIMVDEVDQRSNIKERINTKLQDLQLTLEYHLNNPLTLTLVILLWLERPEIVNAFTTVTQVYEEISLLLTRKLLERLGGKVIDAEDKCKQFLSFHDDIALQSLKQREFDLSQVSVSVVRKQCESLGLPHTHVLSSYFTKKRSRRRLQLMWIWSYLHRGFQEYSAGRAVVNRLLTLSHTGQQLTTPDGHTGQQLATPDGHTGQQLATPDGHTGQQLATPDGHTGQQLATPDGHTGQQLATPDGHTGQQLATPDGKPNVINQILSDGGGQVSYPYEEILYRLTGVLATLNDQLLATYIPHILQLLPLAISYNGSVLIERHLLLVLESKNNPLVIEKVAQKLSSIRIWSCTGYFVRALPPLLSVTQPNEIKMEVLMEPEMFPDLPQTLRVIAQTTVTVTLQLVQHYSQVNKGVSDVYLQCFTSATCKVTEFSGRLSSPTLLPLTLQCLWLRCTHHDLPPLASTLQHLTLKHLSK
ncbi:uncharacterized protein [Panulirus ornatus]|uniref:uncharacterized protein n=1 Tax=Panulirus ornatus TaxID=150431 RepID=UPI003A8355A3